MLRKLFFALIATAVVASVADARIVVPTYSPVEKAARAEIIVVGTVTAIEKESVTAGDPNGNTRAHKIAVLKVEKVLFGADVPKRLAIAFVPDTDSTVFVRPPGRGGYEAVNLAVDHSGVFFLAKDASGEFYTIDPALAPLDTKGKNYNAEEELATRAATVLTDPMKALKAEKAEDRFFAANVLLLRYRSWPKTKDAETALVSKEESAAILKALAEGDWKPEPRDPAHTQGFRLLDLTEKDGWKYPMPKPGADFVDLTKEAYVKWLAGPGKDYRIKKLVPKNK